MDNYLYNGVELPDLPERDETLAPYATIFKGLNGEYFLVTSSEPYVRASVEPHSWWLADLDGDGKSYGGKYNMSNGIWEFWLPGVDPSVNASAEWFVVSYECTPIWSNADITNAADGELILAASDPVRVEPYTSEQYKYLLFQSLRKYISVYGYLGDKYYTRTFFQKLFEGITLTEETYRNFVTAMEEDIQYCADNNITYCSQITQEMIDEEGVLLIDAFKAIGITMTAERSEYSGSATFVKPDGTTMTYSGIDFYINHNCGQEYSYAVKSAPYYRLENMEVKSLDEQNFRQCGRDCWWEYDADTKTMTITGTGIYNGVYATTDIGSGPCDVMIVGAEVSELNAFRWPAKTIVLLQPEDFPLKMTFVGTGNKTNHNSYIVYTDNKAYRNYDWASAYTDIEWHTLDEWEG